MRMAVRRGARVGWIEASIDGTDGDADGSADSDGCSSSVIIALDASVVVSVVSVVGVSGVDGVSGAVIGCRSKSASGENTKPTISATMASDTVHVLRRASRLWRRWAMVTMLAVELWLV